MTLSWTREQIIELRKKYPSKDITSYCTDSDDFNYSYTYIDLYADYMVSYSINRQFEGDDLYYVSRNNEKISYDQFMKMIELKAFW